MTRKWVYLEAVVPQVPPIEYELLGKKVACETYADYLNCADEDGLEVLSMQPMPIKRSMLATAGIENGYFVVFRQRAETSAQAAERLITEV